MSLVQIQSYSQLSFKRTSVTKATMQKPEESKRYTSRHAHPNQRFLVQIRPNVVPNPSPVRITPTRHLVCCNSKQAQLSHLNYQGQSMQFKPSPPVCIAQTPKHSEVAEECIGNWGTEHPVQRYQQLREDIFADITFEEIGCELTGKLTASPRHCYSEIGEKQTGTNFHDVSTPTGMKRPDWMY